MKSKIVTLFTCLVVGLIAACSSGTAKQPVANAEMNFEVEGMVCAMGCAKAIEEKIAGMPGVVSCKVDFESKAAIVSFDQSQLQEAAVKESIEAMHDGQYKVKALEVLHHKTDQQQKSKDQETQQSTNDPVSVSESSFSFPQLITYFMRNL
jgi:copper chaperone CopZ